MLPAGGSSWLAGAPMEGTSPSWGLAWRGVAVGTSPLWGPAELGVAAVTSPLWGLAGRGVAAGTRVGAQQSAATPPGSAPSCTRPDCHGALLVRCEVRGRRGVVAWLHGVARLAPVWDLLGRVVARPGRRRTRPEARSSRWAQTPSVANSRLDASFPPPSLCPLRPFLDL